MARSRRIFLPLSESPVLSSDLIGVLPGEERTITLAVDVAPDQEQRISLTAEVASGGRFVCVITGSCRGRLTIERQARLIGEGAAIVYSTALDVGGDARLSVSDDVVAFAAAAEMDIVARHVVRDVARAEVRSRLVLMPEAARSKAFARAEQLLLGEKPFAGAIPELDIRVDDVSCGHAASVSRPKSSDRFYLASRGLSDSEIDDMLAQAFLCPVSLV